MIFVKLPAEHHNATTVPQMIAYLLVLQSADFSFYFCNFITIWFCLCTCKSVQWASITKIHLNGLTLLDLGFNLRWHEWMLLLPASGLRWGKHICAKPGKKDSQSYVHTHIIIDYNRNGIVNQIVLNGSDFKMGFIIAQLSFFVSISWTQCMAECAYMLCCLCCRNMA